LKKATIECIAVLIVMMFSIPRNKHSI